GPQETERRCDVCNKTIDFGTAGPRNWDRHTSSKLHVENVKKSQQRQSLTTLSSFFPPGPIKPLPPLPVPARVRLEPGQGSAQPSGSSPHRASDASQKDRGVLDRLRELSAALPDTVPMGIPHDTLAGFSVPPMFPTDGEYDSEWEYVDRSLNVLLGYGLTDEEIAQSIRRGPMGMDGLIQWFEHAMDWPGVTLALLEGKIERLCRALILQGAVISSARSSLNTADSRASSLLEYSSVTEEPYAAPTSPASTALTCLGYQLVLPKDQSPFSAYPNLLHVKNRLPWNVLLRVDGAFLIAETCEKEVHHGSRNTAPLCNNCLALRDHPVVAGIERRAISGTHENAPWQYHSAGSLTVLLSRKIAQIHTLRLTKLNTTRKLLVRARALDEHKRLVMAVASTDIQHRVHKVVAVALRNHVGVRTITWNIQQAIAGAYSARSYSEEDYQRAFVLLKLGGQRVANFAHRAFGTPSLSTIRNHLPSPPLRASPGMPSVDEMDFNLSAWQPPPEGRPITGVVMQIDETKLEKRLRWDPSTNMILGVCREHGHRCSLEFTSLAEADVLTRLLHQDQVHLASEVTVVAVSMLSANHHEYASFPFIMSGTCKAEDASRHQVFLDTALEAIFRRTLKSSAWLYCLASDGEARRGKALAAMTLVIELPRSSALYPMLSPLRFFNLLTGKHEITCDKDWLHVAFKRVRNTLIRKSGCRIDGCHLNRSILKRHLVDSGTPSRTADSLLSPNDPQDVVLACRLLCAITRLPPAPDGSKPIYKETRRVLGLLGRLYTHILQAYTNLHATLSDQLAHLSATAHLVMVLYLKDRGGFIPAILYLDLMLMIKNAYFCVAKTKRDNPDGSFWVILLGTDSLEKLFGIIRTMVGADSNADLLQLADRANGAAQVGLILHDHPEWDKGPRRLHMKPLELQGDDISSKVDHINPASWIGDVKVKNVNLHTCWLLGREKAEHELLESGILSPLADQNLAVTPHPIDILRPFGDGKLVYIHGLQQGDVEEEYPLESNSSDTVSQSLEPTSSPDVTPACEAGSDLLCEPDLEDLVDHEETSGGDVGPKKKFTAWLQVGSDETATKHKSTILRLIPGATDITGPESTDRLGRICGFTRYLNAKISLDAPVSSTAGSITDEESSLMIDDPALTLLDYSGKLFLAVVRILDIQHDNSSVCTLPVSLLNEPNTQVKIATMSLSSIVSTEDSHGRCDWEWNGRFEQRGNSSSQDVDGRTIQIIDPQISVPSRSYTASTTANQTYQFKTSELRALACDLVGRDLVSWGKAPRTDTFPYRTSTGESITELAQTRLTA
ncbi:hypothetical protein EIP86_009455, partial [Pleurotus ostreatoroseus]